MTSIAMHRREVVVAGFLLAAVAGCSSDKSAKTTPVRFVVEADQMVNPNERGEASPVVVRIYELKAISAFEQAQFFELFDNDTQKLGADLVARREVVLKPGDKVDFERDTSFDTRYIGVTAGFRLGDGAQWRRTAEVKPDRKNSVIVKVSAQAISIEEESKRDWWKII